MNYEELLDTALSASKHYLRTEDTLESHRRLHGYTVEDVSMDTVEKLLKSKIPLDDLAKSYVWLTTKSVFIDLLRKQDPMRDLGTLKEAEEDTEPLFSMDDTELDMLQGLSEEHLELYLLSINEGLSDGNTGVLLGISDRTVRRRLVPLKSKIKEYLSE